MDSKRATANWPGGLICSGSALYRRLYECVQWAGISLPGGGRAFQRLPSSGSCVRSTASQRLPVAQRMRSVRSWHSIGDQSFKAEEVRTEVFCVLLQLLEGVRVCVQ